MALTKREWWIVGITAGVTVMIATSLGRRTMLAIMGMGKGEIERIASKLEHKAKVRAKPYG